MIPKTADAIRTMTLEARGLLVQEISEQLEGIYGLLPDGTFRPADQYPILADDAEAADTRRRLEALVSEEEAGGSSPQEARDKLVKEAAFTWLNRFVAFKMMEARKLLRETITRGPDSNGFKRWLTRPGNEPHLADYEQGDLPVDGLGEGPRQRAYRRFLLARCAELSREIRVLFDPNTLPSRLCPRPKARQRLIDLLNAGDLEEAWQPGNEETIGWVYQGFNSEELELAFREVRLSKSKFEPADIPAVTQLFTPRWIVRFLVHNTLGRLWMDMHPDSELADHLDYLVPVDDPRTTPCKSVRDITLLDPACGTMHFGLVAFDLFADMYREEMARAGQPGWPDSPPVEREEDIPAAIVARNLHGIDIDLRAVQLSALALFLKAKTLSPRTTLTESRLACADIHMLDGDRLRRFLHQAGLDRRPIYGRILEALQARLKDAEQLGSLLRLEQEIHTLVEQERDRYRGERWLPFPGVTPDQFDTEAGRRDFWTLLEVQIGQALDEFARRQAASGNDPAFFAGETTKGLRLLEVMAQRYDVVVTNPPYMSARKMNAQLKKLVAAGYPAGKGDLYAAFIQRCTEFAGHGGRVGMLTMHSFMFISFYENLRATIRGSMRIEALAHAGPGLFAVGNPGTLQTAAYVLCREDNEKARNNATGTYFRLVKARDSAAKQARFEQALTNLRLGRHDPVVYRYRQGDFDTIPGSPWVYWIAPGLRRVFETYPKLGEFAKPAVGQNTGDNFRFLRFWWEEGTRRIAQGCTTQHAAANTRKKWFPYMKGGGFCRWYGNQYHVVNWYSDGSEVKAYATIRNDGRHWSRYLQNLKHNFRRGVTYSYLTSSKFSARLSPGGFIFDVAGSSLFPEDVSLVLAVLNSAFAHYVLKLINPTVNFQVGDLARLPVPRACSARLRALVEEAIALARCDSEEDETTWDFIAPPAWKDGTRDVAERHARLARVERAIDEEVYRLYGISEEDRRAIEAELAAGGDTGGRDREPVATAAKKRGKRSGATGDALTLEALARRWVGYAVGVVMGRFQPGVAKGLGRGRFPEAVAARLRDLADADGVMVLDPGHSDDLAAQVFRALRIMLGDEGAREVVSVAAGPGSDPEVSLRKYCAGKYFREHIQQYRKRPVYWLLQSPRKKYAVWLFHEKLTRDTLYRIRGDDYVGSKIKLLASQIAELHARKEGAQGRERRLLEKQIADLEDVLDDVREFARRLDAVIERGYVPHIDDGVLINMAPLWTLIPSWQAEPKKCWQALERGDYDWSHQAMDHWPDRVRAKCAVNRSYAIAHGLTE